MKEVEKIVSELLSMSLRVNMHTPFCVFAWDSGHVKSISFRIAQGKTEGEWDNNLKESNIYYDERFDRCSKKSAKELKDFMQNLLDGNYPKVYIAKLDFGVTSISESFDNVKDRDDWLKRMKKKSKIPPEVLLSETMLREEY